MHKQSVRATVAYTCTLGVAMSRGIWRYPIEQGDRSHGPVEVDLQSRVRFEDIGN